MAKRYKEKERKRRKNVAQRYKKREYNEVDNRNIKSKSKKGNLKFIIILIIMLVAIIGIGINKKWFNFNTSSNGEKEITEEEKEADRIIKEITDKALEFGLRKPDRKKHTFQSLMSKIKDDAKEFTFAIEGKKVGKNNNLIEQYRGLEEIESDTIRPYILLNLDKYELYVEEDLSEEEILAKFVKWFNENYADEVIYKKEDFINIVDTAYRMGLRDKKGRKYEIVELIKILELLTHNQRGFIYLAGDRKFKNNSYDEIEKYKADESCIINKEGYEIEIDKEEYKKIISAGNIILFVESEILELITK